MTRLWFAQDLARTLGYRGATVAFWRFCARVGLEPLHDKPNAFDADEIEPKIRDILKGV
ncbi:hypothetical protein NHN26_06405 [Rhodovulum tesquicola]|uniref:hypothetical protein n=1 Tax=Rhodovulum tesquicola TaxID=540254 RepID=UPI002097EEF5|nr:hypothetical protein [Rhodovulum tesquicola]MCO8144855.1 hypothetical protein [Rhodovulum tesquicola]